MADTFTKAFFHIVFSVKYRQPLLKKSFREEVYKYISEIINKKGHKTIIVNGTEDHIHLFLGFNLNGSIPILVREVKNNSSNFINSQNWLQHKFSWQEGYGAFTYSAASINDVYNYIKNQEEHHRKTTFKQEYLKMLNDNNVTYEEKYLFDER